MEQKGKEYGVLYITDNHTTDFRQDIVAVVAFGNHRVTFPNEE